MKETCTISRYILIKNQNVGSSPRIQELYRLMFCQGGWYYSYGILEKLPLSSYWTYHSYSLKHGQVTSCHTFKRLVLQLWNTGKTTINQRTTYILHILDISLIHFESHGQVTMYFLSYIQAAVANLTLIFCTFANIHVH